MTEFVLFIIAAVLRLQFDVRFLKPDEALIIGSKSHQLIRIFEFKIMHPHEVLVDCNLVLVIYVLHVR